MKNNPDLILRSATSEDYHAVMTLYRQLNPEDPVIDSTLGMPVFESIIASSKNILIVGEKQQLIIASCYLNIIPNLTRNLRSYAVIENVITDHAFRNQGVGKALMIYAMNLAWDAGCYKIMLLTGRKSPATLHFYESCGFDPHTKTAFLARNSKP